MRDTNCVWIRIKRYNFHKHLVEMDITIFLIFLLNKIRKVQTYACEYFRNYFAILSALYKTSVNWINICKLCQRYVISSFQTNSRQKQNKSLQYHLVTHKHQFVVITIFINLHFEQNVYVCLTMINLEMHYSCTIQKNYINL